MFYIDAHCDSVSGWKHLDFQRLRRTFPDGGVQFAACFARENAYETVNRQLDALDALFVPTVVRPSDVTRLKNSRSFGMLRAIEGGDSLEGRIERVDEFYGRGVRAFGLTWNTPNALHDEGLTDFGREVIARLEKLGMLVDLAHISRAGFWDAMGCVKRPPIVSHACAAALREHRRNLDNAQLRAVAERGGVVGICLYPPFLTEGEGADIECAARHIAWVHRVAGREAVGLGTDFDGVDALPEGIADVCDMPKLFDALRAAGMSAEDVELAAGGNWARILGC
ncbi:peptidase [Clostridia bacterium]|nr:peptidase [Clostridia bacterium]